MTALAHFDEFSKRRHFEELVTSFVGTVKNRWYLWDDDWGDGDGDWEWEEEEEEEEGQQQEKHEDISKRVGWLVTWKKTFKNLVCSIGQTLYSFLYFCLTPF